MSQIVRLHDVRGDYPHLKEVAGIGSYSHRAAVMSGICIVHGEATEDDALLLEHYAQAEFGAEHVIPVAESGGSLYRDIMKDKSAMRVVRNALEEGRLELFCSSEPGRRFLREFSASFEDTLSPGEVCSAFWGNKLALRQRARSKGLGRLFLHSECYLHRDQVVDAIHRMQKSGRAYVVKDPLAASGEMMQFCSPDEFPDSFMEHDFSEKNGAIIEEALTSHVPFSLVFRLASEGVFFLYASLQMLEAAPLGEPIDFESLKDPKLRQHRGNMVATPGQDLGPVSRHTIQAAVKALRPLMDHIRGSRDKHCGYRGKICVDMAMVHPGYSVALEINARVTHSMYCDAILRQQQSKEDGVRGKEIFVLMANVYPDSAVNGFSAARERIGDLLFTGHEPGLSLYHTRLMAHRLAGDQSRCKGGLIVVANNYGAVRDLLSEGQQRLGA